MKTIDEISRNKEITKIQREIKNMILKYTSHIDNFEISYKDNILSVKICKNRETPREKYVDYKVFEFEYYKDNTYKYTLDSHTGVYGHSSKSGYGYEPWYGDNSKYIIKDKDIVKTIESYITGELIKYMQW
jgi:hypothetical protein